MGEQAARGNDGKASIFQSQSAARRPSSLNVRHKMKSLISVVLLLIAITTLRADGIPFEGDRVVRCVTTVVELTKSQREQLDRERSAEKQSPIVRVALTDAQKEKLSREAGFAPQELEVWPLEQAKMTCTCELLNMAIRFESGRVEVPHFLLGANFDDRHRSREDRTSGKGKPNQRPEGTTAKAPPSNPSQGAAVPHP